MCRKKRQVKVLQHVCAALLLFGIEAIHDCIVNYLPPSAAQKAPSLKSAETSETGRTFIRKEVSRKRSLSAFVKMAWILEANSLASKGSRGVRLANQSHNI